MIGMAKVNSEISKNKIFNVNSIRQSEKGSQSRQRRSFKFHYLYPDVIIKNYESS